MKTTLSERLKLAMREAGYTQASLAEQAGMTQAGVQKLTSGKARSSTRIIEIASALKINVEWLANGHGDMKCINNYSGSSSHGHEQQSEAELSCALLVGYEEVEVPFLKDIELATAGGIYNAIDEAGLKVRLAKSTLLRAGAQQDSVLCFPLMDGGSMEPAIPVGSTVAINLLDTKIIDGKVYAINQNGWKRLKVLYRTGPNSLSIRSYNSSKFADETADLDSVEILGRAFWCAAEL
ncbi:XRE family transcriptional regulator [Edwardsiella piscicida]